MAEKEYIERDSLLKLISHKPSCPTTDREDRLINGIINTVKNYPAADVRPVVMGTWRQIGPKEAVCSVCNNVTLTNGIDRTGHANIHKALYHFCPNCGADMRAEDGEE